MPQNIVLLLKSALGGARGSGVRAVSPFQTNCAYSDVSVRFPLDPFRITVFRQRPLSV